MAWQRKVGKSKEKVEKLNLSDSQSTTVGFCSESSTATPPDEKPEKQNGRIALGNCLMQLATCALRTCTQLQFRILASSKAMHKQMACKGVGFSVGATFQENNIRQFSPFPGLRLEVLPTHSEIIPMSFRSSA